jgi:hypothetical protein
MEEEELLVSKIEFEEMKSNEDNDMEVIRQRNNYYQNIIASNNPPIPLNASCLRKINSKEVFEKQILNRGTHLSTLIPEYKITRDFIFSLLKNYKLFDLTEEESKFLLKKYFADSLEIPTEEEEVLDLNKDITVLEENEKENVEIEEEHKYSDDEFESESSSDESKTDSESDSEDEKEVVKEEKIEKKDIKEVTKDKSDLRKLGFTETTNIESNIDISLTSIPTDKFKPMKEKILKKNNMTIEKIEETKEIKRNISLFLKNALEKRSGIDKKTTIIQFLYKNNFKGVFNASFFDIKDENGELICGQDIIDEWYNAIEQIEEKQKAAFECSQLIITACLYGIEWGSKKLGIMELSNICSEVKDPSNLPKHLESTKRSLSNIIDNNIPNNFLIDLLFFIGNVYIKNKAGIAPL